MPKDRGGLGIIASRRMNVALMLRWVWRILRGEGGLWLQLIQAKYLRGEPLLACSRTDGSQFWRAIQRIKEDIRLGISFSLGNGHGIQFWLDPWLGMEPLRVAFPGLFSICVDPSVLVATPFQDGQWNLEFRRSFGPAKINDWTTLRAALPLVLPDHPDTVSWRHTPPAEFSVGTAYQALCPPTTHPWLVPLWKAPVPLKIKIFVWQLLRDRLPAGTEVLKRHGPGDGICPLCAGPETRTHILFSCTAARVLWTFVREALGPDWEALNLAEFLQLQAIQPARHRRLFWLIFATMSWTLWTTRNKMVIDKVFPKKASDSFFKFLAFLQHWHPLSRQRDCDRLGLMMDALLASARRLSSS